MATIYIDGTAYTFEPGRNLLHTCLSLGFDLPYFCWHPALGSVGACRQCAVKQFRDENDTRGQLVMACMVPATDGIRISINDPEAVQFRAGIIELLMINHPHDCPVCDEGGECHLQDMTVMNGHNRRRFRFAKRTHNNQDLGPFIHHEMNRCIQCYRCVRFYRDYAGGRDLDVFAGGNAVYFGRYEDGPLESEFSGNLVEICPTGVFTDKTLKGHYTRKWDLQTAPSVCVHCGLGCNTIPGERYGSLRRIRNRYHHQVNGYFLCDRGRFGYEFVNHPERIRTPLSTVDGNGAGAPEIITADRAIEQLPRLLSGRVIGFGSPRASLEANFALRTLVGEANFFAGVAAHESDCFTAMDRILSEGPSPAATLQGAGLADVVLVVGEDVTQTAPMLALNLRRLRFRKAALAAAGFQLPAWNDAAVRELAQLQKANLFIAAAAPTGLDAEARHACRLSPSGLVRWGAAVQAALSDTASPLPDLDEQDLDMARETAAALLSAERPLVVAGSAYGKRLLIEAAANIAWLLSRRGRDASLAFCVPECNSLGLTLMRPNDLAAGCAAVAQGDVDTVIVLENDLYRRADAARVDALLQGARHVIVLDHTPHATSQKATLVLPCATFAEQTTTLVNNEGRAQRSYTVMAPQAPVQPAWRWLQTMARAAGRDRMQTWRTVEDIARELVEAMPRFAPIVEMDPWRDRPAPSPDVPRQSHRYTGRTAMHANVDIHEPKPPSDADSPLHFSMEGRHPDPDRRLVPRFWAPGWNSVQALNKFQQEVGGPLRGGDAGRRLIEPAATGVGLFDIAHAAGAAPADGYEVVPAHHIFGSEPLSTRAPGVFERAPRPYAGLPADDPAAADEGRVQIQWGDTGIVLPVKRLAGLPPRTVALPLGLPGMPAVDLPQVVTITPVDREADE